MVQALGDIAEDATIRFQWSTNDGAGGSVTRATDGTVVVYKDNGTTETVAGITDTEDFDSLTGVHACAIDTAADGFYVAGSDYTVTLQGAVIDGETVNVPLASFSIENRFAPPTATVANMADAVWDEILTGATHNIATSAGRRLRESASVVQVSSAINDGAASTTVFDTDLTEVDDFWNDAILVFTSGALLGQSRTIVDYANTNGTITLDEALTSAPANSVTFVLVSTHVHPISQIADGVWDEILTGATHNIATSSGRRLRGIQEFQGYEGGAVWVDTVNGATGTTDYEFGTVENPVKTIAEANTIAASLNLARFEIYPGSTIQFGAAQNNQVFSGSNWTLDLNGQDIAGTQVIGATVSGVAAGTGTMQIFRDCLMNAVSIIKGTHFITCGLAGTITLVEAGEFYLDRSHSAVAGAATVTFDFGAALNASNLNVRNHAGGWTIENMGAGTGTYNATFGGNGQVVFAASCSATSNVEVRGGWKVTDSSGGGVTIVLDDITTDVNTLLSDDIPGLIAALNNIQAFDVWNVDATGHQGAGSFGLAVGDPGADSSTIYDSVVTDIPALIAALNDLTAAAVNAEMVDVLFTDLIPDTIMAKGAMGTVGQFLYFILQALTEHGVVGLIDTVRQIDGATTLATIDLNDPTDPTDVARA
jgi:hypothetical protein